MDKITSYKDPSTGLEIRQLTHGPGWARKTYFSNESWGPDDDWVYYVAQSDTNGAPEIRRVHEGTATVEVVASGANVEASSFGLDRHRPVGYVLAAGTIQRLELGASVVTTAVGKVPKGARPTAHYTASLSGLVCNSYRLATGPYAIIVTDPVTGKSEVVYMSDTPLGHCQFCPGDDSTIFYVHETGGDALQRMWFLDTATRTPRPFFVEQPADWITHEAWHRSGEWMTFIKWPAGIWIGEKNGQIFRPVAQGAFHHCAPSPSGRWIVADKTDSGEIVLVRTQTGEATVLATGQYARRGEDHCHPSFNRKGDKICFTSPRTEPCQVAIMDLNQLAGFQP